MRRITKYKKIVSLRQSLSRLPSRILRFQRPKWKFLQKSLVSNSRSSEKFNSFLTIKSNFKNWDRVSDYFREGIALKRLLEASFDYAVPRSFFKKIFSSKKEKKTFNILKSCLIAPLFRLDILLFRLYFFSSSYQARQYINEGLVLVDNKKVSANFTLEKGSVISIVDSKLKKDLKLKILSNRIMNDTSYLSFVEIDPYTKTIVVVKSFSEISLDDLNLIVSDYFDTRRLFYYFS